MGRDRIVTLVVVLVAAGALAGCSDGGAPGVQEIVVESQDPVAESGEGSEDAPPAPPEPGKGARGHLAGFVVDDAHRVLSNATVTLPGVDLVDSVDRDGAFSFADLRPGSYLVRANATGHHGVEALVEVEAGKFTRLKFVLERIPPPEPYHVTHKFEGFADVTDHALVFNLLAFCSGCINVVSVEPDLAAVVVEATMEDYGGPALGPLGSNGFYYRMDTPDCCNRYTSGSLPNPMRYVLDADRIHPAEPELRVTVRPESSPLPETNKQFEVFVTLFYREPPPAGWSFLEES